jgi:hypothetical protein
MTGPTTEPHAAADELADGERPRGVHLTGSVPLTDCESVFRAVGDSVGTHVRRVPDGETGVRSRWNSWTAPSYEHTTGLQMIPSPPGNYTPWPQARLIVDPDDLVLERLGFADAALASYPTFRRLRDEGILPGHVRFQVCLPSPIAPMTILIERESALGVEPAHFRQLFAEIDEVLAAVPHEDLAIQWDVCQDVGIWEGFYEAYFPDPKAGVIERLTRCADKIPSDVELGFHLCYGDYGHKHFMNPRDLGVVTEMSNALADSIARTINWIHVPVPIDRDDEAYFAPLRGLALGDETEFYLGLIHYDDGVPGAARRIRAARTAVQRFGAATECGFGRRAPETIPQLLALHAEIAAPVV